VTGVDVLDDPWPKVSELGLAEIVKSAGGFTETSTLTEWDREPLVPVTFTMYVPGLALEVTTFRNELPAPLEDRVTVDGLRLAEGPGEATRADRLIVPEKPLRLARPMVDVPEDP
jgi:hypothetical protein